MAECLTYTRAGAYRVSVAMIAMVSMGFMAVLERAHLPYIKGVLVTVYVAM
jgi:hypothetical protein